MGDVFDQVASGQTQASAPSPAQAPAQTAAPKGDVFDQVESDPEAAFRVPAPPMPTQRPSSSEEFDQAQAAGGYTEPAEQSGKPITYLLQKPNESYSDFLKRAVAHGKTVTPQQISDEANQPKKMALGVPARAAELGTGTFAGLAGTAEAIEAGGPMAHKALQKVVQIVQNNKTGTGLALLWAINKGLEMAGLPKASKIVESLELPAILLLSGFKSGASEAAAEETATAAKSAATGAAEKESAEDFVNRQTAGRATVKPNAMGETVDAQTGKPITPRSDTYRVWDGGKVTEHPKNNEMFSTDAEGNVTDLRTAEQKAASQAGQPKAKPQVWQRGPNKGQPKTYRVFDGKQWVEHQKYAAPKAEAMP